MSQGLVDFDAWESGGRKIRMLDAKDFEQCEADTRVDLELPWDCLSDRQEDCKITVCKACCRAAECCTETGAFPGIHVSCEPSRACIFVWYYFTPATRACDLKISFF